jgi:uncharacterized protein (DUF302 family)
MLKLRFWRLLADEELFLPFVNFRWASAAQLGLFQWVRGNGLYWSSRGIGLSVESLRDSSVFSLVEAAPAPDIAVWRGAPAEDSVRGTSRGMKLAPALLLLLLLFSASAHSAECVSYSGETTLTGKLVRLTFPEQPNYESIEKGDAAASYFFVSPPGPICVAGGKDSDGMEPEEPAVEKIQLVFTGGGNAYDQLRPYLGKQVVCRGSLFHAINGHHHTPVLLFGAKCHPGDDSTGAASIPGAAEGLISVKSRYGAKETMDRLENIVKQRGLNVFARIDHAAGATRVGMSLRPTELLIFGNPKGGTPFMACAQTLGIDLPLKALVWQDASNQVWLSYNDPVFLAKRHAVEGCQATGNLSRALAGIAEAVAAK